MGLEKMSLVEQRLAYMEQEVINGLKAIEIDISYEDFEKMDALSMLHIALALFTQTDLAAATGYSQYHISRMSRAESLGDLAERRLRKALMKFYKENADMFRTRVGEPARSNHLNYVSYMDFLKTGAEWDLEDLPF